MTEQSLEEIAERARAGDKAALERVVESIQDKIYGLALRMLWHPEDARDATQEILIRIVTHLGSFRGESAFLTWVYRIACNTLKTVRESRMEAARLNFKRFEQDLDLGLSELRPADLPGVDHALLLEEVKIGCTHGMLLCLSRPQRLAYILGEILELSSEEAVSILEVDATTYRKRLQRARERIVEFMRAKCGLVNPLRLCRCSRRVKQAVKLGRLDPNQLLFASQPGHAEEFSKVLEEIRKLEDLQRAAALYRSHPDFSLPEDFSGAMKRLIFTQDFQSLT